MLKMVAGDLLVLGLSFNNLAKFEAEPEDTYIRVKAEETGLPMDVILCSGKSYRAKGTDPRSGGREIFIVSFDRAELRKLRREAGKCSLDLDKGTYKLPFNIVIFSGETETAMAHDVAELIGERTHVTVSDRLKN